MVSKLLVRVGCLNYHHCYGHTSGCGCIDEVRLATSMMYVWHMAKSVVKLLAQKGKLKDCEQLLPWIQFISNYLWRRVVQTCNGDTQLLTEK